MKWEVSVLVDIIEGALTFLLGEKMNEFLLLNKIKALNMYTEQYIFSSFPKSCVKLYDWLIYSAYATFKSIGIFILNIH